MLPNLSSPVMSFAVNATLYISTQKIVNHMPTVEYISKNIKATISEPKASDINKGEIDSNLRYKMVHTIEEVKINYELEYNGVRYKCISFNNFNDYGYFKSIFEELK